ncbi:MAG: S-methyl-5'-thioadenosine phosphorylase [Candidatus Alcyoniella australis]|nr:S-methyl-5'-thioadenosine phosphorylase [Candidatus Alcyoniella australis]
MSDKVIGVIGGSGLYQMDGMTDVREERIDTPFGEPSDALVVGKLGDVTLAFLPRHGRGHRLMPSDINFRANIYALKQIGAQWIISVSAVGSLKEHIAPGQILIPDQFFDRTKSRVPTFFGEGIVAHVAFADPVCSELAQILYDAGIEVGATIHQYGTYICMEGPQFSTRAESNVYRSWGMDVIGMTNIPEAKLAREAEICYATMAMCTDYDCWREPDDDVSIESILEIMNSNVVVAQKLIAAAVPKIGGERNCKCASALEYGIITDRAVIPEQTVRKLGPIVSKYLA